VIRPYASMKESANCFLAQSKLLLPSLVLFTRVEGRAA
jgi:hypothetical protein